MLRRGDRLQGAGVTDAEIVRRGALPVAWVGERRRVPARGLIQLLEGDELALLVLAAVLDGRVRVPRLGRSGEPATDLLDLARRL